MPKSASSLTHDEGTFLALLERVQPSTAYQLAKIYADSPVSSFGTSKGKIYPMLRRLKKRGLVSAKEIRDGRKSEVLRCTARGRAAVRAWVKDIKPSHLLIEDPLRTMLQSFDLLTTREQAEWIARVRAGLEAKLEELAAYRSSVHVPYKEQVHDNAASSLKSRLAWLDRLEASCVPPEDRAEGQPR